MTQLILRNTLAPLSVREAVRKPLDQICVLNQGNQHTILSIEGDVRSGDCAFLFRCDMTPGLGSVTPGDFVFEIEPNTLLHEGNLLNLSEWRPFMENVMILDETAAGIKRWLPFLGLETLENVTRVYLGDIFSPDHKDIQL